MFDLTGRVIAVIGAGSGIGAAVARACARQGALVACLDLDGEEAERVAAGIREGGTGGRGTGGRGTGSDGAPAESGRVDIADRDEVARTIGELASRHGRLDGVVCTPGVNVRKGILDYTAEEFDRVVAINLKGSFNVLQAAGRVMAEARHGSIVLFASIRAQVVEPGQSVYAACKAGVVQLVKTAAAEFGPASVRVNAVAPGVVETPLTAPIKAHPEWYRAYASRNALGRWGNPEELAGPTAFLLSDAASYLTGTVLYVDGGWTAIDGRFQPPGIGS
jgi:NAD(P)-dependent dehydrogenase (short-subunit alcohol dehydrogenase family)